MLELGGASWKTEGRIPRPWAEIPEDRRKAAIPTRADIERRLARGGLSAVEIRELWHSLFLHRTEVDEMLTFVRTCHAEPFLYPMICLAAHTGARRSELLRLRIDDVDFASGTLVVHEKKRARGRRTSRRVPLSGFALGMLKEWLAIHPGGQNLFCRLIPRGKPRREEPMPVTCNEAHDQFKAVLADSKWAVLRGWHVLRHSFASNCAAAGLDQRIIDEWMGHQTEDMVRRYRHLFPDQQRKAINLVFG